MTHSFFSIAGYIAFPIVGAFASRLRGSSLFKKYTGLGDPFARLFAWAIPFGLMLFFYGAPWQHALAFAATMWATCSIFGNFGSISMGRNPNYSLIHDLIGMAAHGLLWMSWPAATLAGFGYWTMPGWAGGSCSYGWWWLLIAGALCSPIYYVSWLIPCRIQNFQTGSELAEFIWGWVIGACVIGAAVACL